MLGIQLGCVDQLVPSTARFAVLALVLELGAAVLGVFSDAILEVNNFSEFASRQYFGFRRIGHVA